jgi:hypothetical protein
MLELCAISGEHHDTIIRVTMPITYPEDHDTTGFRRKLMFVGACVVRPVPRVFIVVHNTLSIGHAMTERDR